jgi:hypothetical protein
VFVSILLALLRRAAFDFHRHLTAEAVNRVQAECEEWRAVFQGNQTRIAPDQEKRG